MSLFLEDSVMGKNGYRGIHYSLLPWGCNYNVRLESAYYLPASCYFWNDLKHSESAYSRCGNRKVLFHLSKYKLCIEAVFYMTSYGLKSIEFYVNLKIISETFGRDLEITRVHTLWGSGDGALPFSANAVHHMAVLANSTFFPLSDPHKAFTVHQVKYVRSVLSSGYK